MYKETQQQKNAKYLGINISLAANAGTGKTTVLVDRFINLLDNGIDINEIVAITFTKRAASEMIERIANKIDNRILELSQDGTNNKKLAHYRRIRRKLSSANISTIHSFCIDILKDYNIELNLDSNFKQLTEIEKYNINKESIAWVLDNIINEMQSGTSMQSFQSNSSHYLDILFSSFQRKDLELIINKLLQRVDIFPQIVDFYKESYDSYKNKILIKYYDLTNDFVVKFVEELRLNYNLLSNLKYDNTNAKIETIELIDKIISIFEELAELHSILQDRQSVITDDYIEKYLNLVNDIRKIASLKAGRYKVVNQIAKDYDKKIIKKLGDVAGLEYLELSYNLGKEIANVTSEVLTLISEDKYRLNGIDFEDILILTRKLLLERPDIAASISSKYKEIMVDEFQDTNAIQYDIIKALIPQLQNSDSNSPINVFVVGDAKQSIYRFRNADVSIFNEVITSIRNANKYNKLSHKLNNGNLELTANFRTNAMILSFINKVCGKLFDEVVAESGIKYSDLICGKDWEKYSDIKNCNEFGDSLGNVSFLISKENSSKNIISTDTGDNDESEEHKESVNEGILIANEIVFLINEKGYKYSDIAILYRSRTSVEKLKQILDARNLPFIEQAGIGFYENPEIQHLINYLKFLNNQQDDLSLLGVLISPFFSFSNTDLFNIHSMEEKTLWENLLQYCKHYDDNKINNAKNILQTQIKLAPNVSITHLINSMLSEGNWIGRLLLLKSKQAQKQTLRRINAFISLAREFQKRGFTSLSDFIIELNLLSLVDTKNADSEEQMSGNAINLITIHSAKGLEFPIVMVYNLNKPSRSNTFPIISKNYGIGFDIPSLENYEIKEISYQGYVTKSEENRLSYFEELRLLYVAMTRAKEMLYLSCDVSKIYSESFFSYIVKGLGYDDGKSFIEMHKDAKFIVVPLNIKILNSTEEDGANITAKIRIKYIENKMENIDSAFNDNEVQVANSINKIMYCTERFIEKNKIFSFSSLNRIDKVLDGNYNFLQENIINILGFDASDDLDLEINTGDNIFFNKNDYIADGGAGFANQKGVIYHSLLSKINVWYQTGIINETILLDLITNELSGLSGISITKTEIIDKIRQILSTDLLQTYRHNLKNARFEYILTMPFDDNFITGVIDCLIQNEDDEWEIWDWKTNHVTNEGRKKELEENYNLQLKLYIFLLMHLFPKQRQYRARLLFTELVDLKSKEEMWTSSLVLTSNDKEEIEHVLVTKLHKSLLKIIG